MSLIWAQAHCNISNGHDYMLKLALVQPSDQYDLLEVHIYELVGLFFRNSPDVPYKVVECMIELFIQIFIEKLECNIWENTLDRCVDYGQNVSNILDTVTIRVEAVNLEFPFCIVLNHIFVYFSANIPRGVLSSTKIMILLMRRTLLLA